MKGKIVLCDGWTKGGEVFLTGAVGIVIQDEVYQDLAISYPLPASYLHLEDGSKVYSYINSTRYY